MPSYSEANPFAIRETHNYKAVWTYKVLTLATWLIAVLTSTYYTIGMPRDDEKAWRNSIWGQNKIHHTPFALNAVIASLYWLVLFILQIAYVWHLFSNNNSHVQAAAGVGSHFITNNILQVAFIMLFVCGNFVWAEMVLIANFLNLSTLYFRHNTYPKLVHVPAVSGPLAWTFIALYWNCAIAVNAHSLPARILANVAIWGILVYGIFFLLAFKDYTMTFNLSVLTASLGVGQFFTRAIAFQWIFAFTIMCILFVATLLVAIPGFFGKELSFRRESYIVDANQERAPLLDDQ